LNLDFVELDKVLIKWAYEQPMIKPTLHRRANGPNYWYRLQFIEETDGEQRWYNQHLTDCVEWAAEKLKDWPDVRRMAFDMWDFKSKKDAEKFITVFHLSWQQ